jgi:hypothetical protein
VKIIPVLVKDFFCRFEENKFLPFLFFLLVSCCLWLLQALNEKYETDIAFKLNVKGLPSDVELDGDDLYFRVRLRDTGTELAFYKIKGAIPLDVDFGSFSCRGGHLVLPLSTMERSINKSIAASTSLAGMLRDTLFLDVKRGMRVLPIELDGVIDAADGYSVASVEIFPSEVEVMATAAGLEGLSRVRTEFVIKKYLKGKTSFKAKVASAGFMTVEPSEVDVHVTVYPLVERTIRVPVSYSGFPDGYGKPLPSEVEVSFKVPEPDADRMGPKDFTVSLDYGDALAFNSRRVPFNVLSTSHKVENVETSPTYITIW